MPIIRQLSLLFLVAVVALPAAAMPGALAVTVTDAAGEPLADAAVFLEMPGLEPGAGADSATATMDQRNRQFMPYVLTISPGTVVEFPNSDDIRHHVYSFSPVKRFERKLYSGSSAEPVTFEKEGLVTLGCNIHDWMLGFILVNDAPRSAVTDATGTARYSDLPEATATVKVWHPRLGTTELVERKVEVAGETALVIALEVGPRLRQEPPDLADQREQRERRDGRNDRSDRR